MAFFDRFKKQDKITGGRTETVAASQSNLMDFHPYDTGLAPQVLSLVQGYQNRISQRWNFSKRHGISQPSFTLS